MSGRAVVERRHRAMGVAALIVTGSWTGTAKAQWNMPTSQPAPSTPEPSAPHGFAPPPASPPPAFDPSLSAGGLTPPPPVGTAPLAPPSPTEKTLDSAEAESSDRGLSWVYLDAEGGFEHVGLSTFSVNEQALTAGFIPVKADGSVVGAGLGVRLLFVRVGARGRVGVFSDADGSKFQLFSVGPEVGVRIPLGDLEPHFEFGGGYTGLGNVTASLSDVGKAIEIRGFYGRAGIGLDFFPTSVVSIGASATWEVMALTRPGVDPATVQQLGKETTLDKARQDALALDGTSYGSAATVTGVVGLHF